MQQSQRRPEHAPASSIVFVVFNTLPQGGSPQPNKKSPSVNPFGNSACSSQCFVCRFCGRFAQSWHSARTRFAPQPLTSHTRFRGSPLMDSVLVLDTAPCAQSSTHHAAARIA
ncbi:hypothetical protein [Rubritalea tangerina]|uniref:hypothetical protein n=1 Tax=Rubritalea tangerina TaxID=430798 RepID=UPI003609D0E8